MIYSKPVGVKFTDMAIYVDGHVSDIVETGKNPEVEEKVFRYLYHLCYVLACKAKYFKNFEDYDNYSVYAASQVYMGEKNKYIHQGEIRRGEKIVPIKSCLNYIKTILYACKVNYQNQNFINIMNTDDVDTKDISAIRESLRDNVRADYRKEMQEAVIDVLDYMPQLVMKVCKDTPYSKDKLMINRLYKSCLLSFLNSITLPEATIENLSRKVTDPNQTKLNKMFSKERRDCIILWHLDGTMHDYIKVIMSRVKKEMSSSICEVKQSYDLSDSVVDDILDSAYEDYDTDKSGDTI